MALKSIDEFYSTPRAYAHGHNWGPWVLDAERLCLCRTRDGSTNPDDGIYEIDLETVTNPFWMVDWLEHIEEKTWATPEVLGHLTRALVQLLRPRSDMRPAEPSPALDVRRILRRRITRSWDSKDGDPAATPRGDLPDLA